MKREIKFRGKRIDNEEWVYGNLVQSRHGACWIFEKSPISKYQVPKQEDKIVGCLRTFCNEVDPSTIDQFTGLKDKNGNEIYEGDLIARYETEENGDFKKGSPMYKNAVVTFNDCSAFIARKGLDFMMSSKYEFEVNGNIHSNPELL